ncbi:GGDEF domain-containing protein [Xanthobacter variabilis]|uniref:GGDEF domain-containing protein n=1 Tax=Xanthobacter variabilis TaxID=3119932 RepID=UPI00372693B3
MLFTSAMMSGLVAALQFFVSYRLQNQALVYWAMASFAMASGAAILGMRAEFPPAVSIIIGNGLVFAALGLTLSGVRVFDGRTPMLGTIFLGTLVGAGLLFVSLLFGDYLGQRIIIFSLVVGCWGVLAASTLLHKPARDDWSLTRTVCAVLLLLLAMIYFGRAVAVATGWVHVIDAASGTAQGLLVLVGLALSTSWNFGSLYMVLDRLASTDDLTGLLNRRTTLRRGRRLFEEALLRQRAMSILMVDLDHFKSINDRFGHHVGDAVLRSFAETAARSLRPGDLIGRLGGEEFCVILPGADASAASEVGERLRRITERELRYVSGMPVNVTVTVGVATLHPAGLTVPALSNLIRSADEALYRGKSEGRNRVHPSHSACGAAG